MIISDLSYWEDVAEASSIEGGLSPDAIAAGYGKVVFIVNNVSQKATNLVKVSTLNGDANAVANALNNLSVKNNINFL